MQSIPVATSVGIIANPYSSRDIRRLISSATSIQTVERANIVERTIVALGTLDVGKILMMPDKSGIAAHLLRNLDSRRHTHKMQLPELEFLDIPITSTAVDSEVSAQMMREQGVDAIVVLGGDGTHRVVAKEVGDIPLASISTGTNNAFPRFHEATTVGLAVGLYAKDLAPADKILRRNKAIHVQINDEKCDIALVDLAITDEQWIGARVLWHMKNLKELYLAFCEPGAIGMSAIGGLLNSVSRNDQHGLQVVVSETGKCHRSVKTPIAPGLFEDIGIVSYRTIELGVTHAIGTRRGVIALDGEREIEFSKKDRVMIEVRNDGPLSINIEAAIEYAASNGLFIDDVRKKARTSW